jgi:hypothetical protein
MRPSRDGDGRRAADPGDPRERRGETVAFQRRQQAWIVEHRPRPRAEQPVQPIDRGGVGDADRAEQHVMVRNHRRQPLAVQQEEKVQANVQMVRDEIERRVVHQLARAQQRHHPYGAAPAAGVPYPEQRGAAERVVLHVQPFRATEGELQSDGRVEKPCARFAVMSGDHRAEPGEIRAVHGRRGQRRDPKDLGRDAFLGEAGNGLVADQGHA